MDVINGSVPSRSPREPKIEAYRSDFRATDTPKGMF
jgi:hypothetical protein